MHPMLIGVISDTHQPAERRTLWDEVHTAFKGVDLILDAGDIVIPAVLDWLEDIAPVVAARGNNDHGWDDSRMKDVQSLDFDGLRLAMIHIMRPEDRPIEELKQRYLGGAHADIMVTGDTHVERLDFRDGVLQMNPGSPTLPHHRSTRLGTVGLLEIDGGNVEARIVRLGHTEGRPNPGIEYSFRPGTGVIRLG